MLKAIKKTITWGHEKLTLETGKIARQADSSVIATYGETVLWLMLFTQKKLKQGKIFSH